MKHLIKLLIPFIMLGACSNNNNMALLKKKEMTTKEIVLDSCSKMNQKELWKYIPSIKKRPEFYDNLAYENRKTLDECMYKLSPKGTIEGRIQRVERVSSLIKAVAEKRKIPYEYLATIGSQESYFDEKSLIREDDGGVGDFHMQAKTAKEYGLRVGTDAEDYISKKDADNAKKILEENKENWKKISSRDERFHKIKNIDTAARILLVGKAKYGSWEDAIKFYRKANINSQDSRNYLSIVDSLKKEIFKKENIQKAKEEFERLNNCSIETFKKYENIFLSENWGLKDYISINF